MKNKLKIYFTWVLALLGLSLLFAHKNHPHKKIAVFIDNVQQKPNRLIFIISPYSRIKLKCDTLIEKINFKVIKIHPSNKAKASSVISREDTIVEEGAFLLGDLHNGVEIWLPESFITSSVGTLLEMEIPTLGKAIWIIR